MNPGIEMIGIAEFMVARDFQSIVNVIVNERV